MTKECKQGVWSCGDERKSELPHYLNGNVHFRHVQHLRMPDMGLRTVLQSGCQKKKKNAHSLTASGLKLSVCSSGMLRAYRTEGVEFYSPHW
ncbi:hypothetical protein TNCV_2696011 [Trichonephila clavipes]|nr:hypothetical protein TNCV_2696011 [Trichonephila clavipes]